MSFLKQWQPKDAAVVNKHANCLLARLWRQNTFETERANWCCPLLTADISTFFCFCLLLFCFTDYFNLMRFTLILYFSNEKLCITNFLFSKVTLRQPMLPGSLIIDAWNDERTAKITVVAVPAATSWRISPGQGGHVKLSPPNGQLL